MTYPEAETAPTSVAPACIAGTGAGSHDDFFFNTCSELAELRKAKAAIEAREAELSEYLKQNWADEQGAVVVEESPHARVELRRVVKTQVSFQRFVIKQEAPIHE